MKFECEYLFCYAEGVAWTVVVGNKNGVWLCDEHAQELVSR